jgi:aspartate dehydrogenase
MLKIGVIGCGAIGVEICKAVDSGIVRAKLVAIYDRNKEHCEKLLGILKNKPEITSPAELISVADIVIESASQAAVREFGLSVLEKGKDLMVLSVGALLDSRLLNELVHTAKDHNCRIYIPSGAIAGVDGLKSASVAAINRAVLSTTKNPEGLTGTPFIKEYNIDLASFHEKTLLFEGSPEEAVKAFPANINVAATLNLACVSAKEIKVRIFVDPNASRNIHEIMVEGDFGKFTGTVENVPFPANPKTSFLAALSAIAALKKITEPLQIGT